MTTFDNFRTNVCIFVIIPYSLDMNMLPFCYFLFTKR